MIITGDIGGTNARLELHSLQGLVTRSCPIYKKTYPTDRVPSFSALILQFMNDSGSQGKVDVVVCGIPGDVVDNRVDAINIAHWGTIDGGITERELAIGKVALLNDFECAAYALNGFMEEDVMCIRQGSSSHGSTKAIIGVGTGLGVAFATSRGDYLQPGASESGWLPFWEITDDEREMARELREKLAVNTLSFEHVCSGPALVRLTSYIAKKLGSDVSYTNPRDICANHQKCPVAEQSVNLMLKFLGRFLSLLSLTYKPTGGIYLTGGTMDSLLPLLTASNAFCDGMDSHQHPILLSIARGPSVYIIRKPDVGMWGARDFALLNKQHIS